MHVEYDDRLDIGANIVRLCDVAIKCDGLASMDFRGKRYYSDGTPMSLAMTEAAMWFDALSHYCSPERIEQHAKVTGVQTMKRLTDGMVGLLHCIERSRPADEAEVVRHWVNEQMRPGNILSPEVLSRVVTRLINETAQLRTHAKLVSLASLREVSGGTLSGTTSRNRMN